MKVGWITGGAATSTSAAPISQPGPWGRVTPRSSSVTFAAAPVYASATSTAQTGTLNAGTNYVFCKTWGRQIGRASCRERV